VGEDLSKPLRFAWRLLKGTVSKFIQDDGSFLAAGLAFNLLLYCVPFLLLIISALAYALGSSEQALTEVQQSAKRLLPLANEAFANTLATIIEHRNVLGLVVVPLFLVLSSWLFGTIRLVLNVVFEAPRSRNYLKAKASDLAMILVVACLVMLSVGVGSLLAILQALGESVPGIGDFLKPGWIVATHVAVFFFTAALFYTLYRFSPAQTISRRALIVSALTGAALFSFSKLGFSWYVLLAKANTLIYGALAALIFFYLWLYYTSLVFILGAEVGWSYDRARHTPRGNAKA
jgi:membrane protein